MEEEREEYILTEREIAAGVMVGIVKALGVILLCAGILSAIFEFGFNTAIPYMIPATYSLSLGIILFLVSLVLWIRT